MFKKSETGEGLRLSYYSETVSVLAGGGAIVNPGATAETAKAAAERGVHVAIVRLPQVHDSRKQGLVPLLTQMARDKGVSAYVGDGANRWAAAPLKDVAHLYRLAVERTGPGVTV